MPKKETVPKDIKYEFINFLIHSKNRIDFTSWMYLADKDTANCEYIEKDSTEFIKDFSEIDNIFSVEDANFMWKQAAEYCSFTFDQSNINGRKIIYPNRCKKDSHDIFWENIYMNYKTEGYYSLSMPLFSKDLTKVFFTIYGYNSRNGKWGGGYVYKKRNGKWEFCTQTWYAD